MFYYTIPLISQFYRIISKTHCQYCHIFQFHFIKSLASPLVNESPLKVLVTVSVGYDIHHSDIQEHSGSARHSGKQRADRGQLLPCCLW